MEQTNSALEIWTCVRRRIFVYMCYIVLSLLIYKEKQKQQDNKSLLFDANIYHANHPVIAIQSYLNRDISSAPYPYFKGRAKKYLEKFSRDLDISGGYTFRGVLMILTKIRTEFIVKYDKH